VLEQDGDRRHAEGQIVATAGLLRRSENVRPKTDEGPSVASKDFCF
jgi:hypothetical protein